MGALFYYIFIKPLSWLPFRVLYFFSDGIAWILHDIIGYRKRVVAQNIEKAFPDEDEKWRRGKVRAFYAHLSDLIVESIKSFSMNNTSLFNRFHCVNPEILDMYYKEEKDIIIAAGHYGNWEWGTMSAPLFLKHTCVGIYTPLSNRFFEKKLLTSRGRNGLVLISKAESKNYLKATHHTPQAYFFMVDQSPSNPESAYWHKFLGNDTPIQYGVEKYSKENNMPVIFAVVQRVRRGYYQIKMNPVLDFPQEEPYGEVIHKIYSHLEQMILGKPEWWLWSHRRWKHSRN